MMSVFDRLESEVRSYCRSWPTVFDTAKGSTISDTDGRSYLDFFSGAGALNYGHNPDVLKRPLIEYILRDGVTHGLDTHTDAKADFLTAFDECILRPRGLGYRVMFTGPTGTNSVEAALKLARKVTGRTSLVNFTNSFHGMSLGSLSVTGNAMKRAGAGIPLVHATPMPFDSYQGIDSVGFEWFEALLRDSGSSLDLPAAVIVETVQGEGGINVARAEWLRGLAKLCKSHDIILIVDDIQMGVGRTGPFFSFEIAGIEPDIVCLSKSISGYGLPMSLVLVKPEYDQFTPGEHNGTFRGNNHAFVTATAAMREFWSNSELERSTFSKGKVIGDRFSRIADGNRHIGMLSKGRGLARGLQFSDPTIAGKVCASAFDGGLLVETAGPTDNVVKVFPALTISDDDLTDGMDRLEEAILSVISR